MSQSLRTILNPEGIHDPIGYSHIGITNGKRLAFIAGQTASDKEYNIVGVGDLAQQTDSGT